MLTQLKLDQPSSATAETDRAHSPEVGLRALEQASPARLAPPVKLRRTAPSVQPSVQPRGRRAWTIIAAVIVVVAASAVAASSYMNRTWTEAVALQALEREGVLQIEWEGDAGPVVRASACSLQITDGGSTRSYSLTPAELRKGAFAVIRQSDDVTAKLILTDPSGGMRHEISRYLGNPIPVKEDSLNRSELDQLKKQNDWLRRELERERARANELQSWAEVLESSLKKREARQ